MHYYNLNTVYQSKENTGNFPYYICLVQENKSKIISCLKNNTYYFIIAKTTISRIIYLKYQNILILKQNVYNHYYICCYVDFTSIWQSTITI